MTLPAEAVTQTIESGQSGRPELTLIIGGAAGGAAAAETITVEPVAESPTHERHVPYHLLPRMKVDGHTVWLQPGE